MAFRRPNAHPATYTLPRCPFAVRFASRFVFTSRPIATKGFWPAPRFFRKAVNSALVTPFLPAFYANWTMASETAPRGARLDLAFFRPGGRPRRFGLRLVALRGRPVRRAFRGLPLRFALRGRPRRPAAGSLMPQRSSMASMAATASI
jgi:hypothetical protein